MSGTTGGFKAKALESERAQRPGDAAKLETAVSRHLLAVVREEDTPSGRDELPV